MNANTMTMAALRDRVVALALDWALARRRERKAKRDPARDEDAYRDLQNLRHDARKALLRAAREIEKAQRSAPC